ncbi:hypothetical protein Dimus_020421 [Dionaea muscipula]
MASALRPDSGLLSIRLIRGDAGVHFILSFAQFDHEMELLWVWFGLLVMEYVPFYYAILRFLPW